MKIEMTRLIALLLLASIIISACNKSEVIKPIEIHVQVPFPEGNDPIILDLAKPYLAVAENYHKLNPRITITIDYTTSSLASIEDFISLLESNKPSDIVLMPTNEIATVDKKGLLWDLLQLQKAVGTEGIDINPQILNSAMTNGKLLVLPYTAYPSAMLFNKELFDAAHIPYPQGDWTWEQFRDISKNLKLPRNTSLSYDINTLGMLMAGYGKAVVSPDGDTAVGYLDSPEAIQSLRWLNSYYRDDDKTKAIPMSLLDVTEQFSRIETGMVMGSLGSVIAAFVGKDKAKLGTAPLPHFAAGKRANSIFYGSYAISHNSKNPEEAWKFLDYLLLTKNDDSVQFARNFLTTSKSIAEATGQSSDPLKSIYVDEMNYAIKSIYDYSPYFNKALNDSDLTLQYQALLSASDQDLAAKLHDLALKFDQQMNRYKTEKG